ncbi:MAG TPA: heme NO-binding domain-containing protein [Chitinophagaceae bacterium]|nr:heme NO-binding domain-containing protein [Chitinophagaceae bacterium]
MYGIVNKAIEDLVVSNYGEEKWQQVRERSGVEVEFFISNEPYDDQITFQLATAVSEVMEIPLEKVFESFGEWWVLKTSKEKYGGLMHAGGQSLKEFLRNLPVFHNRVMLIYPKLTPPEFRVTDETESSIHLHYYSKREGLQDFVRGLMIGLGKMYETPVTVELIHSRNAGNDHEVFKISW